MHDGVCSELRIARRRCTNEIFACAWHAYMQGDLETLLQVHQRNGDTRCLSNVQGTMEHRWGGRAGHSLSVGLGRMIRA